MTSDELTPPQRLRYSRQRMLPSIGDDGQRRICRTALAIPLTMAEHERRALTYLVAAGLGELYLLHETSQARAHADAVRLAAELAAVRPDARVEATSNAPAHAHVVAALPATENAALAEIAKILKRVAARLTEVA